MKTYWDSSALLEILHDPALRDKLSTERDGTRPHSLAEVFSTLTKGVNFRYSAEDAARMLADLRKDLSFIELTEDETLAAIRTARRLGVRGARIHDLMHAWAARKYGAETLMTLDTAGFQGLEQEFSVRSP
jgi:predicted nucleic acid-binding protein